MEEAAPDKGIQNGQVSGSEGADTPMCALGEGSALPRGPPLGQRSHRGSDSASPGTELNPGNPIA